MYRYNLAVQVFVVDHECSHSFYFVFITTLLFVSLVLGSEGREKEIELEGSVAFQRPLISVTGPAV